MSPYHINDLFSLLAKVCEKHIPRESRDMIAWYFSYLPRNKTRATACYPPHSLHSKYLDVDVNKNNVVTRCVVMFKTRASIENKKGIHLRAHDESQVYRDALRPIINPVASDLGFLPSGEKSACLTHAIGRERLSPETRTYARRAA